VPSDQQKSANQPEMLEECIGGHESLRPGHLLEAVRDERREQGKTRKGQSAHPAIDAGQMDRSGAGQYKSGRVILKRKSEIR
jgi:hypothetical protein